MATGTAASTRLERARAVSALIGSDAVTREAFVGAYTGRGDALDALALLGGNVADPEHNARLERHRRSAFARPDGPADEAAAAASLVALRREAENSDADTAALDRAIAVVLDREAGRLAAERAAAERAAAMTASAETHDASASDSAAPQTRRWVRPVLATAVVVAAIALGAGGNKLVSGALAGPEPTAAPTPITYFRDPAARDGGVVTRDGEGQVEAIGDTAAADRWLGGEQTPTDDYPVAFDDIDPDSTRLVHTGADGWRVWVARGTGTDYCLLAYSDAEELGASSCMDAEGFAQAGAMIGTGNITATWTGAELTVQTIRR